CLQVKGGTSPAPRYRADQQPTSWRQHRARIGDMTSEHGVTEVLNERTGEDQIVLCAINVARRLGANQIHSGMGCAKYGQHLFREVDSAIGCGLAEAHRVEKSTGAAAQLQYPLARRISAYKRELTTMNHKEIWVARMPWMVLIGPKFLPVTRHSECAPRRARTRQDFQMKRGQSSRIVALDRAVLNSGRT